LKSTLAGLSEQLSNMDQKFYVLNSGRDGAMMVLPSHGRILGLWSDRQREDHFWVNPTFLESANSKSEQWQNPGGHRIWIAPEREFFFKNLSDPFGTHFVPASVDPGSYKCKVSSSEVLLESEGVAHAYASNTAVEFGVSRKIRVYCSSEIEEFFGKSCPAAAAGYEESTSVQFDCSQQVRVGAWSLVQVPLGGKVSAATKNSGQYTVFLGEPAEMIERSQNMLTVDFPQSQESNFKIGLAVSAVSNRIIYIQERPDGTVLALIKIFQVGEEEDYVDTPWTEPEKSGSAVQLFYGGEFGFGEIEAHSGKFETTGQRCSTRLKVKVFAFSGSRLGEFLTECRHLTGGYYG